MPSDLPEDMQATLSSEEGRVAELFLNSLKEFGEMYTNYIHTQLIAALLKRWRTTAPCIECTKPSYSTCKARYRTAEMPT